MRRRGIIVCYISFVVHLPFRIIVLSVNGKKSQVSFCYLEMSLSSLQIFAEEYFASLNSIAERISADVAVTKSAYENLWHTLSYKDQSQVIDETIIHPEAVLKYSFRHSEQLDFKCHPRLHLETNVKYAVDEEGKDTGSRWHDKHSAPFKWMTQSQLNLCINEEAEQEKRSFRFITSNFLPIKRETASSEKKTATHTNVSFVDPPSIVLGGSLSKVNGAQSSKLKSSLRTLNTDESLLSKLKSKTAVLRVHTVNASINKKNITNDSLCKVAADKKNVEKQKIAYVLVSATKPPKSGTGKHIISKPKTPPPPPPSTGKQKSQNTCNCNADSEKIALLQESCPDLDIQPLDLKNNTEQSVHFDDSKDSLNSFHVELQSSSSNDVPKTGFDFLDNW